VASLTQSGGTLTGTGTLTVTGSASFTSGTESGGETVIMAGGASLLTAGQFGTITLTSSTLKLGDGTDISSSTIEGKDNTFAFSGTSELLIANHDTLTDSSGVSGGYGTDFTGAGTVINDGTYVRDDSALSLPTSMWRLTTTAPSMSKPAR